MFIRHIQPSDAPLLAQYYLDNRDHLDQWEPEKGSGFYDVENTRARIVHMQESYLNHSSVHFVAFTPERQEVIGLCNFTGILRGAFQACYMGFSCGKQYEGKGLMQEFLTPCIHFMFAEKGLNRIMANHLPHNTRSARLLHRLGFAREGYAKRYLKIAGRWQDHVLRSRICDED